MGGDMVEIETSDAFDATALGDIPLIRSVERRAPTAIRIRVDDAAIAMAEVVDAINQRGGQVVSAQEFRPSFDEVFAVLVERDRVARGTENDEAA
jgi:hypothetical protein